jgi:hypothetical protein
LELAKLLGLEIKLDSRIIELADGKILRLYRKHKLLVLVTDREEVTTQRKHTFNIADI